MTGDPLRARIAALATTIGVRAAAAELARVVPAESIAELAAAGMFRALVPRRHGGDEREVTDVIEGVVALARACPSTAWVASLLSIHAVIAARFDPRAQRELWSPGPDTRIASSVAPAGRAVRGDDGAFRLDGRWSFVSGVDHCAWILIGGLPTSEEVAARGQRDPRATYTLFLVPIADCVIEDDWHTAGLCATGSRSVVLHDVRVPPHRALTLAPTDGPPSFDDSPLARLPWFPLFRCAFPPVALGVALANLEAYRAQLAARVNVFSGRPARLNPGSLVRLAEAAARVDAAATQLRRDAEALAACARPGGQTLSAVAEARVAYDCAFVVDACSDAVAQLWRGSGGKALHRDNVMQRCFRDMFAMTQHGALDMEVSGEAYGKTLLADASARFELPEVPR